MVSDFPDKMSRRFPIVEFCPHFTIEKQKMQRKNTPAPQPGSKEVVMNRWREDKPIQRDEDQRPDLLTWDEPDVYI